MLKMQLINYQQLIGVYFFYPNEHYVLKAIWDNKIDVFALSKIEDDDIISQKLNKYVVFQDENHQKKLISHLKSQRNVEEKNPIKNLLAKVKAWSMDPKFQKIAAGCALTILIAEKFGISLSDINPFIYSALGSLGEGIRNIFSFEKLGSILKNGSIEALKIIWEKDGWVNKGKILSDFGSSLKTFFSEIKDNASNVTFKSVCPTMIIVGNWIFIMASMNRNYQTYCFLKQAREGLVEKRQEIDEIKNKLNLIKTNLFKEEFFSENLGVYLVQLTAIKVEIEIIFHYIQTKIQEAEKQKKLNEIYAVVGGCLSLGSGVASLYAKGFMKAIGIAGSVVGSVSVIWNIKNIKELNNLIQELVTEGERVQILNKEIQEIFIGINTKLNKLSSYSLN